MTFILKEWIIFFLISIINILFTTSTYLILLLQEMNLIIKFRI